MDITTYIFYIWCNDNLLSNLLIGAEGAKTPAGVRGWGDPAGAKGDEEAPRHARGKRSAWSSNQHTCRIVYVNIIIPN